MRFFSKPQAQVNLPNETARGKDTSGTVATYELDNSGIGSVTLAAGGTTTWTWLLSGLNSDYQVRATYISGPSPSGDSLSSWLSLNTNRSWSMNTDGTTVLTIEIRRISDSTIIATASATLIQAAGSGGGGGGGP